MVITPPWSRLTAATAASDRLLSSTTNFTAAPVDHHLGRSYGTPNGRWSRRRGSVTVAGLVALPGAAPVVMLGAECGVVVFESGVAGPKCGVAGFQVGVTGAEPGVVVVRGGVVVFQAEDPGDAGEVDAVADELPDVTKPGDVGVAVPAGAAAGAVGFHESFAFIQPQGLHAHSGEFGGDGDPVDPGGAVTGRDRGWGCSGDS